MVKKEITTKHEDGMAWILLCSIFILKIKEALKGANVAKGVITDPGRGDFTKSYHALLGFQSTLLLFIQINIFLFFLRKRDFVIKVQIKINCYFLN